MDAQDYPARHFEQMTRLAEQLKALPAQLLEHRYSYESFGSWSSILRFKGVALLLTYDGRDRELAIQRTASRKPPYVWEKPIWRKVGATEADVWGAEIISVVEGTAGAD